MALIQKCTHIQLITSAKDLEYGINDDTLRVETSQDTHLKYQRPRRRSTTHQCSWKYFGMMAVTLLAMLITGVVTWAAVHYTANNPRHTMYEVIGSQNCNTPGAKTVSRGVLIGFVPSFGPITYQCLPTDDQHQASLYNDNKEIGKIVQYNISMPSENNSVLCSLCRFDGENMIKMLPDAIDCPKGWTKQYQGYLMTDGLCVHSDMDGKKNNVTQTDRLYLRYEAIKGNTARNNNPLGCVVCSI